MGGCPTQSFSPVSPGAFECLKQKALSMGIVIDSDQGQSSKHGVTIAWFFDPAAQSLELTCAEKPFFVSCETIAGQMKSLVDTCLQPL